MTEPKPSLTHVDLVTGDFEATVDFYKALGAHVEARGGGAHELWHADITFGNGMSFAIDNVPLASTYSAAWRQPEGSSSVILGFSVDTRDAVDHIFRKLTDDDGYTGKQVPYDAAWGARYAIVADPNGIDVGIMSPVDESKRSWPPTPSPDTA